MMEHNVHMSAAGTDTVICPDRVLQEVREAALAAAQMKGFLAGEKIIRTGLQSWAHLVEEEMRILKKAFCWNKLY
ncbi:hypothetical protein [Sphingobacterium bambusae]|uniref:Uncharacterized protein n=1 Tax=Sphingobacterium bambusae TaxID=662858 RepID=A0ABW6BBA5_9SPHI|nr:hypothetical protein [Sphingobacterium bambusae]WPL48906.1 hypothetical protein SCB77_00305 [Sphingobacterium bambusae]